MLQFTADYLLEKLDRAMAEIVVGAGGVGNICLEDYQQLIPPLAWTFDCNAACQDNFSADT